MDIASIFSSLQGKWAFRRSFPEGNAEGMASFTRERPTEYLYREEGVMELRGSRYSMHREYLYRLEEGTICTYFRRDTPLPFQHLEFKEGGGYPFIARGEHLCQKDTYLGEYTFISETEFLQTQWVNGPRKRYIITTSYKKVS